MNLPKLTSAQRLVLSAVGALAISAAGTSLTALDQAYTGGNLNLSSLIVTAMTVFATAFGASLYRYVPMHISDELYALRDTVEELRSIVMPKAGTDATVRGPQLPTPADGTTPSQS